MPEYRSHLCHFYDSLSPFSQPTCISICAFAIFILLFPYSHSFALFSIFTSKLSISDSNVLTELIVSYTLRSSSDKHSTFQTQVFKIINKSFVDTFQSSS
ncbi:uncharacterized protein LOC107016149 isoform X3 [Solanum pennellii]|uniref:Uncharacterized protein LOC107016149 isoform X3 n=1 Tax=Solanum pennellii TaxID=28526 RepID=A0ABM1GK15_SOLPN|nr:uncharacterized protein LOC107016149 isoform X3 [Solanum pennellii]